MPSARTWVLGITAGLIAALIFGGGAVVSRHLVIVGSHPADLTLLRYLGCFPLALAATLVWAKDVRLELPWPRFAILLILGGPPYHLLLITGYLHATAGGGALLVTGLLPVFSIAVGVLLSGRGLTRPMLAGGALTLAGILLFTGLASAPSLTNLGTAIFCGAALAWTLLNHCIGLWRVDPVRVTMALALWSPLFLPVYLLADLSPGVPSMTGGGLVLQLVYHGWLVAFVATLLCFASVRLAGAQWTAAVLALTPLFAAVFGAMLLGEPLTLAQLAGAALTICGIALMARRSPSDDLNRDAAHLSGAMLECVAWPVEIGYARQLRPRAVTSRGRGT